MASVLIVDDDAGLRDALAESVADLGYRPLLAANGAEALQILGAGPVDAALIDLRMPGMDGLELLKQIRMLEKRPVVCVLTAHATGSNTIEAMRLGAVDHLTKPISRETLRKLLARMTSASHVGRSEPPAEPELLVGHSEAIRAVQKSIGLLADSDSTVLIIGETGTGKELVARAIHEFGQRRDKAFVAVNCASIPTELMESELFGHARGAFTGALAERAGAFVQADRGTLLLDEIGDMDITLQAKILRVLQEREVTPVGGRAVKVDVRVIAATHRDLEQRVHQGEFREDLFYRLNVVPLCLPPLRDHPEDIPVLARHFLQTLAPGKELTPGAYALLNAHAWPGNVRELKNAMNRVAVVVRDRWVSENDLVFLTHRELPDLAKSWPDEDLPSAVARLEEMLIRRALERCAGNRTEAAKMLNIHRQLLYAKLKRYGNEDSEDS